MSGTVFDWETMQPTGETIEPDVPDQLATGSQLPEPVALTWENDSQWHPWCLEHPAWGYERRGVPRPPAGSCPHCAEGRVEVPEPSSQTEWERDPARAMNRAAPPQVREAWVLREYRRRTVERARLARQQELRELEDIIASEPSLGSGYVPSPIRDGGTFQNTIQPSPAASKRHAEKVRWAKARRDVLLREPLDVPSTVITHGDGMWGDEIVVEG